MQIKFKVLGLKERPSERLLGFFQLSPGDWDDYSFKTSFSLTYFDFSGRRIDFGGLKIGYVGQPNGWTRDEISDVFSSLPEGWFSLGQDVAYYKRLAGDFSLDDRTLILRALKDIVFDESLRVRVIGEQVVKNSLMREVSLSVIEGQFVRVLSGEAELTDFHFYYAQEGDEKHAAVELSFKVSVASKPLTNVHVIIGRNGVGKTTLLNGMVCALLGILPTEGPRGAFYYPDIFGAKRALSKNYFSSVVSVSFSAFDPFLPPRGST